MVERSIDGTVGRRDLFTSYGCVTVPYGTGVKFAVAFFVLAVAAVVNIEAPVGAFLITICCVRIVGVARIVGAVVIPVLADPAAIFDAIDVVVDVSALPPLSRSEVVFLATAGVSACFFRDICSHLLS